MLRKKSLILVAILGLVPLSACGLVDDRARHGAGAKMFQKLTLPEALAQAKKENKVVMVDFGTKNCGYCRMMDAETFTNASVQQFLENEVIPIKVDADAEPALTQDYGVRGFPTFVFVNAAGQELGRIEGFVEPAPFLRRATSLTRKS
jgi:thiol:disulfide interchange protein